MLLSWLEQKLEPEQFERLEKLRTNLIEIVYVNVVFAFFAIIFWVLPLVFLIWIFNSSFQRLALFTARVSRIRSMAVSRRVRNATQIIPSKPLQRDCVRYRLLQPLCLHVYPVQRHCVGASWLSG